MSESFEADFNPAEHVANYRRVIAQRDDSPTPAGRHEVRRSTDEPHYVPQNVR